MPMFKPKNDDLAKPKPKRPTGVLLILREWWPLSLTVFGIGMAWLYAGVTGWQSRMRDMPASLEAASPPSAFVQELTRTLIGEPIVFFVGLTIALIAACVIARSAQVAAVALPLLLMADVCAAGVYLNTMLSFCSVGEVTQTQTDYEGHVYHAVPVEIPADSSCSEYAAVYRCDGTTCPLYAVAPYPYWAQWQDDIVPFRFIADTQSGIPLLMAGDEVLVSLDDQVGWSEIREPLDSLEVINAETVHRLTLVGEASPGVTADVAFSPDGRLLAVAGQTGVLQYPVTDLSQPLRMLDTRTALYNTPVDVRYSIDGQAVLGSSFRSDGYFPVIANTYLWRRDSGTMIDAHAGADAGGLTLYSPDGQHYARFDYGESLTLGTVGTNEAHVLPPPDGYPQHALWSADGRLFALTDNAQIPVWDEVTVWDAMSGDPVLELTIRDQNTYVSAILFSVDSQRLLVQYRDLTLNTATASLFDVKRDLMLDSITMPSLTELVMTPDSSTIYGFLSEYENGSVHTVVSQWDIGDAGRIEPVEDVPLNGQVKDWTRNMRFSPDGELLLATAQEPTVETEALRTLLGIYAVDTGSPLYLLELPDTGVMDYALSPDGRLLAVAGLDGRVRLYAVTG